MTTPFPFPPEYHFPPFFTRQTNLTTHHAQLIKWSSLVLAYCRHHRILKLSLSGEKGITMNPNPGELPPPPPPTSTTTTTTTTTAAAAAAASSPTASLEIDTTDLFHNKRINRRLSPADIREVIDFLRKDGRAEYVGGSPPPAPSRSGEVAAGSGATGMAWIYWRTPEEWAALVEGWVDATGQKGSVLTVFELVEGDGSRGTEFHGLDQELLLKALQVLVKRGKAQVFGNEDSLGVKFF